MRRGCSARVSGVGSGVNVVAALAGTCLAPNLAMTSPSSQDRAAHDAPAPGPVPVVASGPERRSGQERRIRWQTSHGWRSRDILRATALVFALYWILRLLWFANPLVLAAFLGVLFGLAVTAGVDRLQRFRVPRGVGAFVIVFGFLGLLGGFFAWSGPTLAAQSRELRERLPVALDRELVECDRPYRPRRSDRFIGLRTMSSRPARGQYL